MPVESIIDSNFTNNNATQGGVIHNNGNFEIINSTFNNNQANDGGVIYNSEGEISIKDSTFTINNALNSG